ANKNGSREYLFLSGNSSFVSIYIDGRDCCQTGQFSQDVADGASLAPLLSPFEQQIGVNAIFKSKF
ncbi:hypothetical protein, partial [Escherichia coli]|uniref:hypothetical protein n=1 Tax=Escherichia coli TaxID=562 RepID=UPI001BC86063